MRHLRDGYIIFLLSISYLILLDAYKLLCLFLVHEYRYVYVSCILSFSARQYLLPEVFIHLFRLQAWNTFHN